MTSEETSTTTATSRVPDASGRFSEFGGRFVPETLMQALEELTADLKSVRPVEESSLRMGY